MLDKAKLLQVITEKMATTTVTLNGLAEGSTEHTKKSIQLSMLLWLLSLVEDEAYTYIPKKETEQQQQQKEAETKAMTALKVVAHKEAKAQAIKDNAELESEINRLMDAGEDGAALQLIVFGNS